MENNRGPIYHSDLIQGSDEWLKQRCGIITASEMNLLLTPTLSVAKNDKVRIHAFEMAFQRLTGFVEPQYVSDAMLRGQEDEIYARAEYEKYFAPVKEIGFITSDKLGFTIGYSPDGLVGDNGLIECKSRKGKYQVQTIAADAVPDEFMLQLQTGLMVSGREWIDFISYSGGLPMFVKRVLPDDKIQSAIVEASETFESQVQTIMSDYKETIGRMAKVIETERREMEEMKI